MNLQFAYKTQYNKQTKQASNVWKQQQKNCCVKSNTKLLEKITQFTCLRFVIISTVEKKCLADNLNEINRYFLSATFSIS